MTIETNKETININQIIKRKKDILQVTEDVIVNDVKPDILNVINTNGTVCVYKREIQNGKIKIDGGINTYIIYLADDENGSIRTLNTYLDFTYSLEIENSKENMILDEDISIKNFETQIINGRKINLKANLEIDIKVYENSNFEIISDIADCENLELLRKQEDIMSLLGEGNSKTYAKDTIDMPENDDLAEIMKVDFQIVNKDIRPSYNKILIKADSNVKIMYLTEDNRINTIGARIPIMGFVDIQNVNENTICLSKIKLKNLTLKPNYSDEHSIYIEAELDLSCFAYETKQIDIIEDLYGLSSNVTFSGNSIEMANKRGCIKETKNIRETISIQGNEVYDIQLKPIIENTNTRNGKATYEGKVLVNVFSNNNTLNVSEAEIPFNLEIEDNRINGNAQIETTVTIGRESFNNISSSNIEINADLEFDIQVEEPQNLNIIEQINAEDMNNEDPYSMIIYFVKEGDSLWKIAKKYKSKVSEIARINNIEDENKIYVGEQLYIPKFDNRKGIAI